MTPGAGTGVAAIFASLLLAELETTGMKSKSPPREAEAERYRQAGLRFSGFLSLAAEYCFMIPAEPLAHNTPLFTGWFRLP